MFSMKVQHCISLISLLIGPSLSTTSTPDSLSSVLSPDIPSYSSSGTPIRSLSSDLDSIEADANDVSWLNTDMGYSSSSIFDDDDYLTALTQDNDNDNDNDNENNNDDSDLFSSDTTQFCPAGKKKKRNGDSSSCASSSSPPSSTGDQSFPQLQIPNLLQNQAADSSASILQVDQRKVCPAGWHLCCSGPPTLQGTGAIIYIAIANCIEGMNKPDRH